jgi:hypothetical protein
MMVLNRVVQKEDQDAIARLIVGNIFKNIDEKVLRTKIRLIPLLRNFVIECCLTDIQKEQSHIYEKCADIRPQIIQHILTTTQIRLILI